MMGALPLPLPLSLSFVVIVTAIRESALMRKIRPSTAQAKRWLAGLLVTLVGCPLDDASAPRPAAAPSPAMQAPASAPTPAAPAPAPLPESPALVSESPAAP